jgi:hypothetical protein
VNSVSPCFVRIYVRKHVSLLFCYYCSILLLSSFTCHSTNFIPSLRAVGGLRLWEYKDGKGMNLFLKAVAKEKSYIIVRKICRTMDQDGTQKDGISSGWDVRRGKASFYR